MQKALTFSEKASKIKPGKYRHFKGGEYQVLGVGFYSEDPKQKMVIYKSFATGQLWVRPIEIFLEQVEKDGCKGPRFKLIDQD